MCFCVMEFSLAHKGLVNRGHRLSSSLLFFFLHSAQSHKLGSVGYVCIPSVHASVYINSLLLLRLCCIVDSCEDASPRCQLVERTLRVEALFIHHALGSISSPGSELRCVLARARVRFSDQCQEDAGFKESDLLICSSAGLEECTFSKTAASQIQTTLLE